MNEEKVAALAAAHGLEAALRPVRLPCLYIIGLPSTQEFVRGGALPDVEHAAVMLEQVEDFANKIVGGPAGRKVFDGAGTAAEVAEALSDVALALRTSDWPATMQFSFTVRLAGEAQG